MVLHQTGRSGNLGEAVGEDLSGLTFSDIFPCAASDLLCLGVYVVSRNAEVLSQLQVRLAVHLKRTAVSNGYIDVNKNKTTTYLYTFQGLGQQTQENQ